MNIFQALTLAFFGKRSIERNPFILSILFWTYIVLKVNVPRSASTWHPVQYRRRHARNQEEDASL